LSNLRSTDSPLVVPDQELGPVVVVPRQDLDLGEVRAGPGFGPERIGSGSGDLDARFARVGHALRETGHDGGGRRGGVNLFCRSPQ
jgi:hypothetical protein